MVSTNCAQRIKRKKFRKEEFCRVAHCVACYVCISQGVFVVSTGKRLEAYYDVPNSNGDRIMMHPETFTLQAGLQNLQAEAPRPQEVFRALCMTHDGHIAWVPKKHLDM